MNDFAFLAIILGFFALAALFVAACDRIIGADEDALPAGSSGQPGPAEDVAA